jgi:hypothetical protein
MGDGANEANLYSLAVIPMLGQLINALSFLAKSF